MAGVGHQVSPSVGMGYLHKLCLSKVTCVGSGQPADSQAGRGSLSVVGACRLVCEGFLKADGGPEFGAVQPRVDTVSIGVSLPGRRYRRLR